MTGPSAPSRRTRRNARRTRLLPVKELQQLSRSSPSQSSPGSPSRSGPAGHTFDPAAAASAPALPTFAVIGPGLVPRRGRRRSAGPFLSIGTPARTIRSQPSSNATATHSRPLEPAPALDRRAAAPTGAGRWRACQSWPGSGRAGLPARAASHWGTGRGASCPVVDPPGSSRAAWLQAIIRSGVKSSTRAALVLSSVRRSRGPARSAGPGLPAPGQGVAILPPLGGVLAGLVAGHRRDAEREVDELGLGVGLIDADEVVPLGGSAPMNSSASQLNP
jgi:hypothetical protein